MPQAPAPIPPRSVADKRAVASRLTERQAVCLELASQGLCSRQIGRTLGLSARTVDDHILFACRILGVRTRVQAVALMARDRRRNDEDRSFRP